MWAQYQQQEMERRNWPRWHILWRNPLWNRLSGSGHELDFRCFAVQCRNVRSALNDKLSVVEVHRVQCRNNEQVAELSRIWRWTVFTNLRHTHRYIVDEEAKTGWRFWGWWTAIGTQRISWLIAFMFRVDFWRFFRQRDNLHLLVHGGCREGWSFYCHFTAEVTGQVESDLPQYHQTIVGQGQIYIDSTIWEDLDGWFLSGWESVEFKVSTIPLDWVKRSIFEIVLAQERRMTTLLYDGRIHCQVDIPQTVAILRPKSEQDKRDQHPQVAPEAFHCQTKHWVMRPAVRHKKERRDFLVFLFLIAISSLLRSATFIRLVFQNLESICSALSQP